MYRGLGVTMVRAFIGKYAPAKFKAYLAVNAVTFYGYEWVKDRLERQQTLISGEATVVWW